MKIKRGEIYLADLSDSKGSEQSYIRPVLIIQNNVGNRFSPTTIIAPLSSKVNTKADIPTHYLIKDNKDLYYDSLVMLEQIKVIDKSRIIKKITKLSEADMHYINNKIRISLATIH